MRHSPTAILAGIGLALILRPAISPAQKVAVKPPTVSSPGTSAPNPGAPLQLTLKDAIRRAQAMDPAVRLAEANAKIAAEKIVQTRTANLPIVAANSQFLYTEGNGTPAARYIANNGVHEYIAQGDVHQSLSVANIILYRQSIVAAALSRDQAEIAKRGLVVAVVLNYATAVAANLKYQTQQQATQAAQDFLQTTQKLQTGGEVARADVVKAQIQFDDSRVALQDAELVRENARVALALMVFPDVNQNYELVDDPAQILLLPEFDDAEAAARQHNPALDAAFKAEQAASKGVAAARADYLPTVTFDYFYGIDANHFATTTPSNPRLDPELRGGPIQNLGYSALASLSIPIWNWGATHSRVKSAEDLQQVAASDLKYAQRKLIADLKTFYGEARVAKSELDIRREGAANAEESQKLTLLRYKAGQATALEVVDAEATLSLERNAYYDAETRYATALANLATLTGDL